MPSPTRATIFFTVTILLLMITGMVFRSPYQLTGVVVNEVLFAFGLGLAAVTWVERRPVREVLRLRWLTANGTVRSILLGLLAWALAHVLGLLIVSLVQRLGGQIPETHSELLKAPFWVAMLIGAAVPAICEEVAFRGYIQWGLQPLGSVAAVVVTGLLFGAMHLTLIRVVPLVMLGLVWALAVQRTGSILPGIIMHFVNNGTAIALSYLVRRVPLPAGSPEASGGSGVVLLVVTAAALGFAVWGVARGFGPGDVAPEAAEAAAEAGGAGPDRVEVALPLIPAALLYGWAVWAEWSMVFGGLKGP